MLAGLPRPVAIKLAALFAASMVFYLWAWPTAPLIEGDSPQYMAVAVDLSDGRIDALHDRSPGYPLLLTLTGSAHQPTRTLLLVSLFLHFSSIWFLAAALHDADAGPMLLLAFAGLLALPLYVEPAGHVMTENLAQFLLAVGTSWVVRSFTRSRPWMLGAASLALAAAAVTRPTYQALGVALGVVLLLLPARVLPRRQAVTGAVSLAIGPALVLGTMAWHNSSRFDYFGLVPTAGVHLSTKTMSFVERLPDEYADVREILIRERDAQLVKRGGTHTGTQTIWSVREEIQAATGLSKATLSSYLVRMNLTLIGRAPVEYLQEVARSLATYWFPAAGSLATLRSSALRWLWAALHLGVVGFLVVQLVTVSGTWVYRVVLPSRVPPALAVSPGQWLAWIIAGTTVLYTMVLSCFLDIGEVRQRRPTDALVLFMCVAGLCVWLRTHAALTSKSTGPGQSGD
jgi:hypothetical protein